MRRSSAKRGGASTTRIVRRKPAGHHPRTLDRPATQSGGDAEAIAWETEVWLTDTPNHMIHYDGQKYLGPRK